MTTASAAVTGIGAVSALGVGAQGLHDRWMAGESGIRDGGGKCESFDPSEIMSAKAARRVHRCVQMAVAACQEAVDQAWAGAMPYAPERVACILGVAFGGMEVACEQYEQFSAGGTDEVWTLTVPVGMPNASPAVLAINFGFRGETYSVGTACAASGHAIGSGLRLLRADAADAVVVGGAEAPVTPFLHAAFTKAGALSRAGVPRPFDRDRDGFVLGEGAGVLILENEAKARSRGARILARLAGYGSTTDAHHLTAPMPDGAMCARAITLALEDAGMTADDVDYINAHGTGTVSNDRAETVAIKRALGDRAYDVPVSAPKSTLGHAIGAAGGIEAVSAVLALQHRVAHPTVGHRDPEEGLDLNYVAGASQELRLRPGTDRLVGLSNSFAFGGHNVTLVFTA